MDIIHQPHDKFFKIALKIKEVMIDFLLANLPQRVLKKLDLSSVELQDSSFVDGKFKTYASDVLYKVNSLEGKGYLYFLLEHQSTSDPFIVVRLLQYIANIVNYDMKQQLSIDPNRSNLKFPTIYPFVLYSGKERYKWPKSFSIELEGQPLFDLSSSLIELQGCNFEGLLKSKKAALVQILLRESWKKDFCKVLKENPQLAELINNSPYAKDALLYLIDQDKQDAKEVINAIENLNKKIEEEIMNGLSRIAQRGEERGRSEGIKIGEQIGIKLGEQIGIKLGEQRGIKLGEQRGIKLGEQRGFKEAIIKLLAHGMDKAKAAEMLDLTLKNLEAILNI